MLVLLPSAQVLVPAELQIVRHRHQWQWLVALAQFYVGKPTAVAELHKPVILQHSFAILLSVRCGKEGIARSKAVAQPNLIVLEQRKHLLVGYRVHVSDNRELFATVDDPFEKLAEEGERRVGDDEVGLVTQLCNLMRTEVTVAVKVLPAEVVDVDAIVAVGVSVENEDAPVGLPLISVELRVLLVLREEWGLHPVLRRLGVRRVARGDEFSDAEELEVKGKVSCKVAPFRVVARHEYRLVAEHVGVVVHIRLHLVLNVGQLRVELVVLRRLGRS